MTHKAKIQKRKEVIEKLSLVELRDEAHRRFETLNIICKMKENNLTSSYPAIKTLLEILNNYVITGKEQKTIIDFPQLNKYIKVYLPLETDKECIVVMKAK